MNIRTLIVDDEPLARERLRGFLGYEPSIEIVGEASNGREAVGAILQLKPDLVFLDVQMPEMDGFAVIEALGDRVPPAVVFATAYDQFAVKAFEVHAVDYLLKPFDSDRLSATLQRVVRRLQATAAPSAAPAASASAPSATANRPRLDGLLQEMKARPESGARLLIKSDKKMVLVPFEEIDWVESADNYVVVHAGKENHIQRETLSSMESRLPADRFVRISRSTIVNATRIKELQPLFHGEYAVILKSGARLTLTRTYRDSLSRLGVH
jgi:two-component system LytT family response regulator